jgi:hypothetical protein
MKKNSIFFIALILLSYSCKKTKNNELQQQENVNCKVEEETFNGTGKFGTTVTFTVTGKIMHQYNTAGLYTGHIYKDSFNYSDNKVAKRNEETTYTYDALGYLTQSTNTKNIFNRNGTTGASTNTTSYLYQNGNLVLSSSTEDVVGQGIYLRYAKFKYDNQNNLIQSVDSVIYPGNLLYKYVINYTYNNGILVSSSSIIDNIPNQTKQYQTNSKGLIIMEKYTMGNTNFEFRYSYDVEDNLILTEEFNNNVIKSRKVNQFSNKLNYLKTTQPSYRGFPKELTGNSSLLTYTKQLVKEDNFYDNNTGLLLTRALNYTTQQNANNYPTVVNLITTDANNVTINQKNTTIKYKNCN